MQNAYVLAYRDEEGRIFLNDQIITQTRFFSLKKGAKIAKNIAQLSKFSSSELDLSLKTAQSVEAKGLRKIALFIQVSKKTWFFNRALQGYYKSYTFLESRKAKDLSLLSGKDAYLEKLYQEYENQGYQSMIIEKGESLKIMNTNYFVTPQSCLDKGHTFKVKEVENFRSVQNIIAMASEVEVFEKEKPERHAHITYACPELLSLVIYFVE